MNIIYILIPLALMMGIGFLIAFIRMSMDGQYDDLDTPAYRLLIDDSLNTGTTGKEKREKKNV